MSNKRLKQVNQEEVKKPIIDFSKINKKIMALVLALVVFFVASLFIVDSFAPANPRVYHKFILSTFSGSFDSKGSPNSAYDIKMTKDESTGNNFYTCVNFKFSCTNGVKFKEIWINISDVNATELNVFTSKGNENSSRTKWMSERTISRSQIKTNKDGWFRIFNVPDGIEYNVPGFYGQLKVGFSAPVKLREVVIVDVNGKLGSLSVKGCSYGRKPTEQISEEHVNYDDPLAQNVVDEQSTFVVR